MRPQSAWTAPQCLVFSAVVAWVSACTRPAPSTHSTLPTVDQKQETAAIVVVSRDEAVRALCELYSALDADCDRRLTIMDQRGQCARPPCALGLGVTLGAREVQLTQLHAASQLATELAEGLLETTAVAGATIEVNLHRALQNPVEHLEERIETRYWQALTRTLSTSGAELQKALFDEKQGPGVSDDPAWCDVRPACATTRTEAPPSHPASEGSQLHYLYVPSGDAKARELYSPLTRTLPLRVVSVPNPVSAEWVSALTEKHSHGLLSLAYDDHGRPRPFVVPGGRFNEMYGWDSYFISLGLLESGLWDRARDMAEHQAYQIVHYGKVLNANRTYYLTRSQPPFFAGLVRKVLAAHEETAVATDALTTPSRAFHTQNEMSRWRVRMLQAAEREYTAVWSAPPRRTELCNGDVCLARYHGEGVGQPPEVEPGHFSAFYQEHATSHGHCVPPGTTLATQRAFLKCVEDLERAYVGGHLRDPQIDAFFLQDQCVRESGHDTTFRWFKGGRERCTDFATVDLNVLLLQYELDVAYLHSRGNIEDRDDVERWCERARKRAELIQTHLWSDTIGAHFDFDVANNRQSTYLAATSLYPLWVEPDNVCRVSLLTEKQSHRLVSAVLPQLEAPGGLLATAPRSLETVPKPTLLELEGSGVVARVPTRQWEAPNGWAPHQMIAWAGLQQHGFERDAQRLAYRWLLLIAESAANFHGTVPEKFDVVNRTHQVFAEYGNVNTEFSYIAKEGFGWMNASFLVGLKVLSPEQREKLYSLTPPDASF